METAIGLLNFDAPRGGAPLAPPLRHFLEERFRANFSDVLIHTDLAAADFCAGLRARAATFGRHIYFGEGEYRPGTRGGMFLLAHELVHVLQQQAGTALAAIRKPAIGSPADPCEEEADRVAAEALGSGRRSEVTPDQGTIRCAASFNEYTATITTDHKGKGVIPDVQAVNKPSTTGSGVNELALLHLTRNKGEILSHNEPDGTRGRAIRLTGTVVAAADSRQDLDSAWKFHLMQFFYLAQDRASYAGKTSSDGCIFLDFAGPGTFAGYRQFLIDADDKRPARMPWAEMYANVEPFGYGGQWTATVINDDHPYAYVPRYLTNPAARNQDNFLFHVTMEFRVVTCLVVVDQTDPKKVIKPLCWLEWSAMWDASIHWYLDSQGNERFDQPRMWIKRFDVNDSVPGAPPYQDIAALIKTPPTSVQDTFNVASMDARVRVLQAAGAAINTSQVQTLPKWDTRLVPADHFK